MGKAGEKKAKSYLTEKGYSICEENYTCRQGEIDLVAWEGDCLVFIEVRAGRELSGFGEPFESIGWHKQRRLTKLSQIYLHHKKLHNCSVRFDVVSLLFDKDLKVKKIELIKNAF